jgi:hypothetical protein
MRHGSDLVDVPAELSEPRKRLLSYFLPDLENWLVLPVSTLHPTPETLAQSMIRCPA